MCIGPWFQIKRDKSAKRKEAREKAQREEKERMEKDRELAAAAKASRAATTTTTWAQCYKTFYICNLRIFVLR
jgi:hypothetical protein